MRLLLVGILALATMAMGGKRPPLPEPNPGTGGGNNSGNLSPAEPYGERFKELGKTYGAAFTTTNVAYSFRAFLGAAIGVCTYSSTGNNRVALSSSAWAKGSDTFREMLVFHELGHCMLGRGHKNSRYTDGRPESIMASMMFDERLYTANREAYLKELFTSENNRGVQLFNAMKDVGECGFGHKH